MYGAFWKKCEKQLWTEKKSKPPSDSRTATLLMWCCRRAAVVSKCRRTTSFRARAADTRPHRELRTAARLFVRRFVSLEWKIGTLAMPWSLWCATSCLCVVLVSRFFVKGCPALNKYAKHPESMRQWRYANLGSHFHSNSLCLLTQGHMFGLWFCVACRDPGDFLSPVCCCRDLGDCLSLLLVWSLPLLLSKDFRSGMVSDGFQTQRRGSWILGKERAEKVLASAVSIDWRKEWTCKYGSESDVWTRWRCRRCHHDIPAFLRGKYRQAIAARWRMVDGLLNVEWRGRKEEQKLGGRESGASSQA